MATQISEQAPKVQTIEAKPIMTVTEQQALEKRQAQECDYYAVFLKDESKDQIVRVRTAVWQLDAERNPVVDEDGKKKLRNPHDVALDVWAAYGADDHTLELVMRGSQVVATPQSIANELAMAQTSRAA